MSRHVPPSTVTLDGRLLSLTATDGLDERSADLARRSKADNTLTAYRGHVKRYDAWCRVTNSNPWEIATVAHYLTHCHRDRSYHRAALSQAFTALRLALRAGRLELTPDAWAPVRALVRGASRELAQSGVVARGSAPPLRLVDLTAAVVRLHHLSRSPGGREVSLAVARRDRALLLAGYFGGLRRAELVSLNLDDVTSSARGLEVRLRSAKATPGEVLAVSIPSGTHAATDPVGAWSEWLEVRPGPAELELGGSPAWLRCIDGNGSRTLCTGRRIGMGSVAVVLRRSLRAVGVADWASYRSHSLRAGLATELAECGVSIVQIANAGRWDDLDSALRYARRARRWSDSPLHALSY